MEKPALRAKGKCWPQLERRGKGSSALGYDMGIIRIMRAVPIKKFCIGHFEGHPCTL